MSTLKEKNLLLSELPPLQKKAKLKRADLLLLKVYHFNLTLLHSERPNLHTILAFLSAIGLIIHYLHTNETSFCSYARPAQPGPNRTKLCGPYIAAKAGD